MCGLNGIVSTSGSGFRSADWYGEVINKMNDKIIHRGPDSAGIFINGHVAFGFRRLSIIDLSDQANQPMVDKASLCIKQCQCLRYLIVYTG